MTTTLSRNIDKVCIAYVATERRRLLNKIEIVAERANALQVGSDAWKVEMKAFVAMNNEIERLTELLRTDGRSGL